MSKLINKILLEAEAITVYHGTDSNFEVFDINKSNKMGKFGLWFTDDKSFAEMFGTTVKTVSIDLKKPKVISSEQWDNIRSEHAKDEAWFMEWKKQLIAKGFDGLHITGGPMKFGGSSVNNPNIYAVFNNSTIKNLTEAIKSKYQQWANSWFPNTLLSAEIVLKGLQASKKESSYPEHELNITPEAINFGCCDFIASAAEKAIPGAAFDCIENYPNEIGNYYFPDTNGHSWFKYKGKYYDAEAPNGVNDWRDLPLMKKCKKQNLTEKILKESTLPNSLKTQLSQAAQKVYNEWEQNENNYDEMLGEGGICQDVAEAMANVLTENNIECTTVSQTSGEQHVYVVAQLEDGVYIVDISPYTYETGGGYNWKKIPDVEFTERDIIVSRLSSDPNEYENYIEY